MISNWFILFLHIPGSRIPVYLIEYFIFRVMANQLRLLGERLQSRGPEQAGLGGITTRSDSPYSNEEWWNFPVHFFGSEDAICERLRVNREAFEDALAFVAAVGAGSRGRIISIKQLFFFGMVFHNKQMKV